VSDKFSSHFRPGNGVARTQAVFTNRVREVAEFESFVQEHQRYAISIDPISPDVPRRNILNFYGFGGIGKSTLLHRLQDTVKSTSQLPATTALIDFQEPTSFNMEDLILKLRIAAGQLGYHCNAFDLAFSFYWSVVHPGTPLETYTKNNSLLRRTGEKVGLSEEMEGVLSEIASTITSTSGMAVAGTHLIGYVAKRIREGYRTRHAVANCPILPMFLDPDTAVDSLTYLPSLLAWDIAQAGACEFAVFFDTYENVTAKGRQVERAIQRICYLMPNVMFVIAGRNRVDWDRADLRGALDYVGPDRWPLLSLASDLPGNRCILIGELSTHDSDEYLQQRLRINGAPAIPKNVRNRIIKTSNGWPLHLDMAAAYYQEMAWKGSYELSEFEKPFPALVMRIASDLTPDERSVLLAAALFDSFDAHLVGIAAGGVTDSTVWNVINRPYVKRQPGSFLPYSLHVALRQVLRADNDFWSPADWRRSGTLGFDELGRRASTCTDRNQLSNLLLEGLRLSREFELPVQWLSSAGRALSKQGGLDTATLDATGDSAAAHLSCLLDVVAKRGRVPFRSLAEQLHKCAGTGLTQADSMWAKALEADALLSMGHSTEAADIYTEVLASRSTPADISAEANTMFALTLLKRGSFTELSRLATSDPSSVAAPRLLGDVFRNNARWVEASEQYNAGLVRAEREHDAGLAALFRAELALVEGWTAKVDPVHWAISDSDIEHLEPWTRSTHYLARALYAIKPNSATPNGFIDDAEQVAVDFGMNDVLLDVCVTRAFLAATNRDTDQILKEREKIGAFIGERNEYRYLYDVVGWWGGDSSPENSSKIQWVDGLENTRKRWMRVVEARIAMCLCLALSRRRVIGWVNEAR
jgi:hypothetical protein